MAKGGYLSWNPVNWFKSAPEEPVPGIMEQPAAPVAPMGGPYGGKKRKTRRSKKTKKSRSKTGRKH